MNTTTKYAIARFWNIAIVNFVHHICSWLLLLCVGSFFACSVENEIDKKPQKSPSDVISLSSGTSTRASIATLSTMETDANGFTVFATLGSSPTGWYTDVFGSSIDGSNKHKYVSGGWTFVPDIYWPVSDYPITFYALFPAAPTGLGAWDYGFSPLKLRAPYTVPATASAQQDVLAAKLSTASRPATGEESITFNHILTYVDFDVIAGIGTTPQVQSLQLVNIRNNRTYDFIANDWESSTSGNASYTYFGTVVPGGVGGSSSLPLWSAATADESTCNPFYSNTTTPTAANAHLMLMPQTAPFWSPVHGSAPTSSSGGYVTIIYRMGTGSGTTGTGTSREVGYVSANQHPDFVPGSYAGPLFVKAGFPLPGSSGDFTWQRGVGYAYHVGLGTPNSCNGYILDEYYYNDLGNRTNLKLIEVIKEGKRVGDKLQDGEIHLTLGVQKWEEYNKPATPVSTIKVAPQFIYLPYTAQTPSPQTIAVTCYDALGNLDSTIPWTLTVPTSASWLQLTSNSDGMTNVGASVSGTGSSVVYLVSTANNTNNLRIAEIYLDNVVTNVVTTVVQDNVDGSQGTPPAGTNTYAGAFWRATQTGERIIRINMGSDPSTQSGNWGPWNAFVAWTDSKWHPAFNDGVVLSTDKLDPTSLTARNISFTSVTVPLDAEHPDSRVISYSTVAGGTVSSGGIAQFRIGLQSPFSVWHPTTSPARYALVVFLYGTPTKAQKILLRQGEGADVVADGINAARWSVYNVTGQTTPTATTPYFTVFPSQAGYLKKFSTATTLYAPIGSITTNTESDQSAIANVCPDGYRIPTANGTGTFSSANEMGMLVAGGTNNVWGYYADGYFDRRQLVNSPTGESASTVNVASTEIAYMGRLYWNVATNASLFFPGAGSRIGTPPSNLHNTGSSSTYWSNTYAGSSMAWTINSSKSLVGSQASSATETSYTVRCVSDYCIPVSGVSLTRTPSSGAVIVGNTVLLTAQVAPINATSVTYVWQRYSPDIADWVTFNTTFQNTSIAIITTVGANQFRVLASNGCGGVTGDPLLITGDAPGPGGSAARITWDAAANGGAGGYAITYDPRNGGLYFKFGSVVGIYSDHEAIKDLTPPLTATTDPYHPTDVAWTPEGVSVTYPMWYLIPSFVNRYTDESHDVASVKAGLGDPCRLVGLDLVKIQSTPASDLTRDDIDNKIWRYPSEQENLDFSGFSGGSNSTTAHWWNENQVGNISFGVRGGEFPARNAGGMHKFLPTAGSRDAMTGLASGYQVSGYYWCNFPLSVSTVPSLSFTSSLVYANQTTVCHTGASVRCVPNICIPVTSVTISPSSGTTMTGNTFLLTSTVTAGATNVTYQWQQNTLLGWKDLVGETEATCSVIVSEVGNNQFRVIATNGCSSVSSSPAIITGTLPVGGSTGRITWDATANSGAGGYAITHDPRNAGLYFKYGSVVGIYSHHASIKELDPPLIPSTDAYHPANDVAWTPQGALVTYPNWSDVPNLNNALKDITLFLHTPANVKAGLGDPCRLVGLNLTTIQNTVAGSLTMNQINNYTWRLPTTLENLAFTGYSSGNNATTVHWWNQSQSGNISFDVAGAEFPSRGSSGMHKFLPAAGYRDQIAGTVQGQTTNGYFWSNEISLLTGSGGSLMSFTNSSVMPDNGVAGAHWAVSVRCIYDLCIPVQSAVVASSVTSAVVGTAITLTGGASPTPKAPVTYIWERSVDGGVTWQQIGNTVNTNTLVTYVAAVGTNSYRIRAGNECAIDYVTSVNVNVTGTEPATAGNGNTNVYVGAYWRATETGERIIRINAGASGSGNTGPWVATVLARDARFSTTDIVFASALTGSELTSRNISWTTPIEPINTAESYQLSSTATSISGTVGANEYIEFRIGLKTAHTNVSYPARYAVVLLSYGNGKWQKIYIRQGHAPDYLMRTSDAGTSVPTGRPAVARFSPYNLTDPNFNAQTNYSAMVNAGTGLLGARGATFVDYPTKAGYFFQFNLSTRAFHPVSPLGQFTNWDPNPGVDAWSGSTDETCPNGYRRPNDGQHQSGGDIIGSEVRQSLWMNPPTGNTSSLYIDNSTWGYYADGFFDRRALNTTSYGTNGSTNTSVSYSNEHAAYIGRLFYNQATRASLFFPASGYRTQGNGALNAAGVDGAYWPSSTSFVANSPWHTYIQSGNAWMTYTYSTYGYPVRCVEANISVSSTNVWLSPSSGNTFKTIQVVSSGAWTVIGSPSNAMLSATSGSAGTTNLTLTRSAVNFGASSFDIKNNTTGETITVHVDNYQIEEEEFWLTNNPGVNTGSYAVDVNGGSETFTIVGYSPWVTSASIDPITGELVLKANQSPDGEIRTGYITLAHANDPAYQVTFSIIQDIFVSTPPFKYFVVWFTWATGDVDIAVEFANNYTTDSPSVSVPFDNNPVYNVAKYDRVMGYAHATHVYPDGRRGWMSSAGIDDPLGQYSGLTSPLFNSQVIQDGLMFWGGDARQGQGETVFFNAPQITPPSRKEDHTNLPREIKLELYAGLNTTKVTVTLRTYEDGIMLKPNNTHPQASDINMYNFYNVNDNITETDLWNTTTPWNLINAPAWEEVGVCNVTGTTSSSFRTLATHVATITYDRYRRTAKVDWHALAPSPSPAPPLGTLPLSPAPSVIKEELEKAAANKK